MVHGCSNAVVFSLLSVLSAATTLCISAHRQVEQHCWHHMTSAGSRFSLKVTNPRGCYCDAPQGASQRILWQQQANQHSCATGASLEWCSIRHGGWLHQVALGVLLHETNGAWMSAFMAFLATIDVGPVLHSARHRTLSRWPTPCRRRALSSRCLLSALANDEGNCDCMRKLCMHVGYAQQQPTGDAVGASIVARNLL